MTEIQRYELAKLKGYRYCPMTGTITGMNGSAIKGKSNDGYIIVQVYAEKLYVLLGHRLAWFLHYGEIPKNQIDHIDGDRTNNKIENLRDVCHQQNQWNRKNAKGYNWNKKLQKHQAQIRINRKPIHLGVFDKEEDAQNAYLEAKKKYHIIN